MPRRAIWLLGTWLVLYALAACRTSPAAHASGTSSTCAVTRPPTLPFMPPAPYPARLRSDVRAFWYGTPRLWTMLEDSGTWRGLPHTAEGYSQKMIWSREGYSMDAEPLPALTLSGRRLDAPAPPLKADRATNASTEFGQVMMTGMEIPSIGCWEITGQYHGQELSFVVWVEP